MSVTIYPSATGAHDAADGSFAAIQPQAYVAAGVHVFQGYGGVGSPGKWETADEAAQLAAVGIASIIGAERGSSSWRGGAPEGAAQGTALRQYRQSIGCPGDTVAPFAFDSNYNDALDRGVAQDFMKAARDNLGDAGVAGAYGDLDCLNALIGLSGFNWLTGATAWSRGVIQDPNLVIHMKQGGGDAGLGVDWDVVLAPFRAWRGADSDAPVTVPPVVMPVPVPVAPKAGPPLPTLSINKTGKHDWRDPYVRVLQTVLVHKTGHNMPIDANFGPITQAAVKDLQKFFHLTVDGVVGPKQTWPVVQMLAAR